MGSILATLRWPLFNWFVSESSPSVPPSIILITHYHAMVYSADTQITPIFFLGCSGTIQQNWLCIFYSFNPMAGKAAPHFQCWWCGFLGLIISSLVFKVLCRTPCNGLLDRMKWIRRHPNHLPGDRALFAFLAGRQQLWI